jgi:hypothetical protein
VVKRDPPELTVKFGPFLVIARGAEAVRAVRRPIAVAIAVLVPTAIILSICGLSYFGGLRSILRKWWP